MRTGGRAVPSELTDGGCERFRSSSCRLIRSYISFMYSFGSVPLPPASSEGPPRFQPPVDGGAGKDAAGKDAGGFFENNFTVG